jgi:nucleoside-diphosphate-sugar epimerase
MTDESTYTHLLSLNYKANRINKTHQVKNSLKILVTGANGFTGQHFSKLATAAGYDVVPMKSNLNDIAALDAEILAISPDQVIHFAGISFVASKDDEAFYRVHALGTSNLLNALLKLPKLPKKVLLASSATIYGNSANLFSIETQAPSPIDHYAMSKVAMEEMAKTYFDKLPIVIARPFNYTGIGQKDNFLIPKLVKHFINKAPRIELGNLDVEREFNDVSMICDAYLALLQFSESGEIYNVCSGQAKSLQNVVDTLSSITKHQIQIHINPDFIRANEVHRMCGDPAKLQTLLAKHQIQLHAPTLENTLGKMLTGLGS